MFEKEKKIHKIPVFYTILGLQLRGFCKRNLPIQKVRKDEPWTHCQPLPDLPPRLRDFCNLFAEPKSKKKGLPSTDRIRTGEPVNSRENTPALWTFHVIRLLS